MKFRGATCAGTPSLASNSLAGPARFFRWGGIRVCESHELIVRFLFGHFNASILKRFGTRRFPRWYRDGVPPRSPGEPATCKEQNTYDFVMNDRNKAFRVIPRISELGDYCQGPLRHVVQIPVAI